MRAGLARDANQLLGADLLVNADNPVPPAWRQEAQRRGLLLADTVTFPSMAQGGEGDASQAQLASIKAVSPGYPLRGILRITTDPLEASAARGVAAASIPAPGTVWVDANLLTGVNVKVGDAPAGGRTQLHHHPADRGRAGPRRLVRQLRAARDAALVGPEVDRPGRRFCARDL